MATLTDQLTGFYKGASNPNSGPLATGMGTLQQILSSQGATDPRLFNQQSAGISRDTQSLQQALQGSLARSGMMGSGVGLMANAAIGQAGANQQAGLRANEAQLQEQRKRQDLQLLMQLILGPSFQMAQHLDYRDMQNDQAQAQKSGAWIGGVGSLLGGGANIASGFMPKKGG